MYLSIHQIKKNIAGSMHACTIRFARCMDTFGCGLKRNRKRTDGQADCFKLLLGTNVFEINENVSRFAIKHQNGEKRIYKVLSTS